MADDINICVIEFPIVNHVNVHFTEFFYSMVNSISWNFLSHGIGFFILWQVTRTYSS